MAVSGRTPPAWFWFVAVLLVLWEGMGLYSFYEHVAHGPGAMGAVPTDYDRRLFAGLPGWYVWVFGVATWGGLAAGIALLLRSRFAEALAWISLIAIVVMFGWMPPSGAAATSLTSLTCTGRRPDKKLERVGLQYLYA